MPWRRSAGRELDRLRRDRRHPDLRDPPANDPETACRGDGKIDDSMVAGWHAVSHLHDHGAVAVQQADACARPGWQRWRCRGELIVTQWRSGAGAVQMRPSPIPGGDADPWSPNRRSACRGDRRLRRGARGVLRARARAAAGECRGDGDDCHHADRQRPTGRRSASERGGDGRSGGRSAESETTPLPPGMMPAGRPLRNAAGKPPKHQSPL